MAARPPVAAGGPPPEQKKGEVNELRVLLRTVNTDKDSKRKRDVIKKVIAYMTVGIDVSRLFSDMILACNTRDLVVKKMVYLYLCAYAQSNADLTLLAINTLQKDCRDEDPMIRGLALRSLSGLRLTSILEYVMQPLKAALTDSSGYVRQAGVIGLLKVFSISPETIREENYVDTLYNMLRDRDAQVVVNCIAALNEILAAEGGIAVNQAIVVYMLNRIREFSDWGQCAVMELVSRYKPANDDELFGIMNLLDGCLKVANSAVVMAAVKCFLAFTADLPEVQRQVFLRLKTPMLTLMASSSNEVAYAVLSHVALVIERAPGTFDDEYKQFFCKYAEPSSVKALKMRCLPKVANPGNAREIVAELTEYVSGVDAELARQAVRAIGAIAIGVPPAADVVVESLLELVEMEAEYVRSQTVVVMQDLLRKYPDRAASVIPSLHRTLKRMDNASGKAAVIWMLGEFGHLIDDAPYLLEPLIDALGSGETESDSVRCELLAATVKLFFKRPPEVQRMMGRLFKSCLAEGTPAIVHDRALLYYRLLRTDVKQAAAVIGAEVPPVDTFHEDARTPADEAVWREFNSLSVVYGKPSEMFIQPEWMIKDRGVGGGAGGAAKPALADSDESLLGNADNAMPQSSPGGSVAPAPAASAAAAPEEDLLGISYAAPPAPAPAAPVAAPAPAPLPTPSPASILVPGAVLAPADFQAKWGSLPGQAFRLQASRVPATSEVEGLVRAGNMPTIASGDVGTSLKFYFFGREAAGAFHLFEVLLDKSNGAVNVTLKSENPAAAPAVAQALAAALRPVLAA